MLFDGNTNAASPAIEDQLMDTGDLGYLDVNGRLISGGENVFPRPVEEATARLPQVADVAVVGVSDSEFGQRLAAYVVCTEGSSVDEEMVRGYVRNRLSHFSISRDVMFVNQLPRTATGKICRALRPERY
jgi:acyl-CoA synthetase (AMP-forming)/AMP-acid ligase II